MSSKETLEIDGRKVHFQRLGSGDKKLIILHGWATQSTPSDSYHSLAPTIAEKTGYEVILPDLPGFGDSDPPPPEGWTTYDYADWLGKFLEKLNINKAVLYGHSFGCRVTVRFLARNPHLVEKAILTGAAGIKWPPSLRQKISLFLSKKFTKAKRLLPQKIQKFIITKIFGARDWGAVPMHLKETLKKTLAEADVREELKNIQTRILIIWGERDKITPLKSGEAYATTLPNAEIKIISDAKHGLHSTHPNEIISFVTKFLQQK